MKRLTFSLFIIAIISTLGCSTENPLCTDNFCIEGEIYPKSDLAAGVEYVDLPIDDAVIFATLAAGTTPVETTPAESVPLDAIVADTAKGGTTYIGETLTITAPVQFVFDTSITLLTKTDSVSFYVKNPKDPEKLNVFQEGKTYTLTVEIVDIEPPDEEFNWYAIWSNMTSDASIVEVPPVEVTVASLIADVAVGGTTYVGKTIKVNATVEAGTAETEGLGLGLITNNNDVLWIAVYPKDTTVLDPYVIDQSYTFTLLIHSIDPPDPTQIDQYYTIYSVFVEAE